MKTVALSVDDSTPRRSRAQAGRLDASLPTLMRGYLIEPSRRNPDGGKEKAEAELSECNP